MAMLPAWTPLWNEYPDYIWFTSDEVKRLIGGKVNAAWITNTCAVRLSRTLNYNDLKLPAGFPDLNYVKGADGLRYCYRVREIRRWLMVKIGRPQFDHHKQVNTPFDKGLLAGKKGSSDLTSISPTRPAISTCGTGGFFRASTGCRATTGPRPRGFGSGRPMALERRP
jgi:hypothetical protein